MTSKQSALPTTVSVFEDGSDCRFFGFGKYLLCQLPVDFFANNPFIDAVSDLQAEIRTFQTTKVSLNVMVWGQPAVVQALEPNHYGVTPIWQDAGYEPALYYPLFSNDWYAQETYDRDPYWIYGNTAMPRSENGKYVCYELSNWGVSNTLRYFSIPLRQGWYTDQFIENGCFLHSSDGQIWETYIDKNRFPEKYQKEMKIKKNVGGPQLGSGWPVFIAPTEQSNHGIRVTGDSAYIDVDISFFTEDNVSNAEDNDLKIGVDKDFNKRTFLNYIKYILDNRKINPDEDPWRNSRKRITKFTQTPSNLFCNYYTRPIGEPEILNSWGASAAWYKSVGLESYVHDNLFAGCFVDTTAPPLKDSTASIKYLTESTWAGKKYATIATGLTYDQYIILDYPIPVFYWILLKRRGKN